MLKPPSHQKTINVTPWAHIKDIWAAPRAWLDLVWTLQEFFSNSKTITAGVG